MTITTGQLLNQANLNAAFVSLSKNGQTINGDKTLTGNTSVQKITLLKYDGTGSAVGSINDISNSQLGIYANGARYLDIYPSNGTLGLVLRNTNGVTYSAMNTGSSNLLISYNNNTNGLTLDVNGNLSVYGSTTTTGVTSASALSVTSATTNALTIDSGTTGAVNIGTNANAKTITIGNTTGATGIILNSGTGGVTATKIFINRNGNVASGINWFTSTYTAWTDYMANFGDKTAGPTANITAPSGTLVTSWGKRSFIENSTGYGWTFESGTNTSTTPSVVAEIRSSDGAVRFGGTINGLTLSAINVTAAGALTINSTTTNALTLDSTSTGAINIGTNANAKTLTIGNSTGATGIIVNSGTSGVTFNQVATGVFKVAAAAIPTANIAQITNTGYSNVSTNVSALNITYIGGAAAVESSAMRIDNTPGTTSGGIWSSLRIVPSAAAATSVIENGVKFDNITAGSGTTNMLYAGTGWNNIISYNGTSVINGTGQINASQLLAGTAPISNGGTGATSTVQGGIVYGASTSAYGTTAAGTSGYALISNGTSAPTWNQLDMTYLSNSSFKKSVKCATTADLGASLQTTTTLTGYTTSQSLACTTTAASTTITTTSTAGLKVGAVVSAATVQVASGTSVATIASATTFTVSNRANITTTAITGTGSVATATFAAQTYTPYAVGSSIVITGTTPATYTGTFAVTACTTTTVSWSSTETTTATVQGTIAFTIAAGSAITTSFAQSISALVIDGVTVVLNDRILVKNQSVVGGLAVTANRDNGIYYISTLGTTSVPWVLTRTTDANTVTNLSNGLVAVDQGATYGGYLFDNDLRTTDTLGTTAIPWNSIADNGRTLNYFASTTSSQLASVISDGTGTGALVFGTSPTITTPTLAGNVTLSTGSLIVGSNAAVAAAGTTQATATAITKDLNAVTSGTGGVILPTGVAGRCVNIANNLAVAINVYPATSCYIDALAVNAAISIPAGSQITLYATSTTNWESSLYLAISWGSVVNKPTTIAGYGITDGMSNDPSSKQTLSSSLLKVQSPTTTNRFEVTYNDTTGSLDFCYYVS